MFKNIKKILLSLLIIIPLNIYAIDLQDLNNSEIKKRDINDIESVSSLISSSSVNFDDNINSDNKNPIFSLNSLRNKFGLKDLSVNSSLSLAAKNHAYYLLNKDIPTHNEDSTDTLFTGNNPLDRAIKTGYVNNQGQYNIGEVVSAYDGKHENDIDKFLIAIYHRFIILDPKFKDIGYYYLGKDNKNIIEIMLGANNNSNNTEIKYTYYPYDNQDNIPTTFYPSQEIPNPMPNYNKVGYPISFQVTGGNNLVISNFEMKDSKNNKVEGKVLTSANDKEVQESEFAFIPLSILKEEENYYISISGYINGKSFSKEWSFKTEKTPIPKVFTDKKIYNVNNEIKLMYNNIENPSISFTASIVGSKKSLIKIESQKWGEILLKTLPGCDLKAGCDVLLKIIVDQNVYSTNVKVMP